MVKNTNTDVLFPIGDKLDRNEYEVILTNKNLHLL